MRAACTFFPKFWPGREPAALAELAQAAGLDGVDLAVRAGQWCTPENLAARAAPFVEAVRRAGLAVPLAIVDAGAAELAHDPARLRILADAGVPAVRFGYFRDRAGDPRAALAKAARDLERLATACSAAGLRGIVQLHHGTLFPSASSVWPVVAALPPAAIGVQIDPGNQTFEGAEDFRRTVPLLGAHLAAVGMKDSRPWRDPARAGDPDKGWRRDWVPLDEGVVPWNGLAAALRAGGFAGPFDFQPFYAPDDDAARFASLRREVAWWRACWAVAR